MSTVPWDWMFFVDVGGGKVRRNSLINVGIGAGAVALDVPVWGVSLFCTTHGSRRVSGYILLHGAGQ